MKRLSLAISLVLLLFSCSKPKLTSFPSLSNQGQLALSTSNPSLGANLFLSSEMERSSYLLNFLKGKGGPTAIEIIDDGSHPPRILLYYPRDKEVYAADMMTYGKDGNARQWVVRGPYQIDRKDYKNLMNMEMAMNGEPVFMIHGKEQRFRFNVQEPDERVITALPPPIPTPRPKPKKKVVYQSNGEGGINEVNPRDFRPLNSDQQAIQMSKGFAERALNGDVLHTVRTPDESLESIAKWYTGAAGNVSKLVDENHLSAGVQPAPGARITIPLKMVKEFKQMPEGFK